MGGGTMRAAAKVAGIPAANGCLRGILGEQYPALSASIRAVSGRPASAAAEEVKLVASESQSGVQRTISIIDDWMFAGEDEVIVGVDYPLPRVVFGGAPTIEEAKQATSELTVALEKAYLSDPKEKDSFSTVHDCSSSISSSQVVENKACVSSEIAVAPAVPLPAIKAFKLLNGSSVAQNVVASIACDPNVWNAVLQNQELQEFLQSQKTGLPCSNVELVTYTDILNHSYPKSSKDSTDFGQPQPDGGIMDFVEKIKVTVVDMVSSLSDYFQHFFGDNGTFRTYSHPDGTARLSADTVMEASFMGLAVMAIMVILLNRA